MLLKNIYIYIKINTYRNIEVVSASRLNLSAEIALLPDSRS